jgi:molybdopterin converting factor subunit 1
MKCEVLLFARLADEIGRDRLTIDLDDGATVADAVARLTAEHEALARLRDVIAVAVNEQYGRPETPLSDGDTLALIPPVSGG